MIHHHQWMKRSTETQRTAKVWHLNRFATVISLNGHKLIPIAVRPTVNALHSWQRWCLWHRFTEVDTEVCFILEDYLKREVQSECRLKLILMQSAALMLLILIQDLMLLSALAVSYCLPLRTFSAPLLPHTNTLSGLESATKFNNRSEASPKNTPSAAQHFAFSWPLESRPEVQPSDSSWSLCPFFVEFQVSHLLQQALTRQHYGERDGMRDILLWLESRQLESGWGEQKYSRSLGECRLGTPANVSSASTDDQTWAGYRGDKHPHTYFRSFSFITNFELANVIKILFHDPSSQHIP